VGPDDDRLKFDDRATDPQRKTMRTTPASSGALPAPSTGVVAVRAGSAPPALDRFSLRAGPDVAYGSPVPARVYAVFSIDRETNELRVVLLDETGRLLRAIPADSIAEMQKAMLSYAR
jgi:hypothetical protein